MVNTVTVTSGSGGLRTAAPLTCLKSATYQKGALCWKLFLSIPSWQTYGCQRKCWSTA